MPYSYPRATLDLKADKCGLLCSLFQKSDDKLWECLQLRHEASRLKGLQLRHEASSLKGSGSTICGTPGVIQMSVTSQAHLSGTVAALSIEP
jgi:hypothetical protein